MLYIDVCVALVIGLFLVCFCVGFGLFGLVLCASCHVCVCVCDWLCLVLHVMVMGFGFCVMHFAFVCGCLVDLAHYVIGSLCCLTVVVSC